MLYDKLQQLDARSIYFSVGLSLFFNVFSYCVTAISLRCHQLNKNNVLERNYLLIESIPNYLPIIIEGTDLGARYSFSQKLLS